MKKIEISISQCLSSTQEIEVPDDFKYDKDKIMDIIIENVILPSDCLIRLGYYNWYIDDICVV